MKLKNVFLSVGMFIFALGMFGLVSSAEAATCTAEATGLWSAATTWDAACNTGTIPLAGDSISIPGGFVVTVDINTPVVGVITVSNAVAGGATGITISGTNTLSATSVSMAVPVAVGVSTIAIGTGTLDLTGNLTIMGGADGTKSSIVTVSTGTLNVDGNISFNGGTAAQSQLTCTAACNLNVGGNFGDGATIGGVVTPSTGTLTLNGSGAQVLSTGTTVYNNLVIAKSAGTASIAGQVTIGGTLAVNSGTFSPGAQQLTVTGTTTIASGGTLLLANASANKTFTGDVTIASGGTWTESAADAPTFAGSLANSGTYTANTGVHTFSGTAKIISGTVSIPNLTISGTVSNTNTLTVSAALAGGGTLTNLATGVLNLGGTSAITTLTATAAGNTVNYNGAGQTVKVTSYHDLDLTGSGTKAIGNGTAIANDFLIGLGVKASLTGSSTTKYMRFNGSLKKAGAWGFTGAVGASFISTSYFATNSGTEGKITASHGASGTPPIDVTTTTPASTTTTTVDTTTTTVDTTTTTTTTTPTTPVVTEVAGGCSGGNVFNTSTGKPCTNNTGITAKKVYALGQTTLKNGSKGEAVKELQRFLNDKLSLGLVVDGSLGPKTIAVIKTWQKNNGLVADGLIGAKTKAMMNK